MSHATSASFSLSQLDVRTFDVFTVVSHAYWKRQRSLVHSFFEHLAEVESIGFIVAPSEDICRSVVSKLGVSCVGARRFADDKTLSKARWDVLLHFARRKQRIAYVGLDVRFLQPVGSLFEAVPADADFAFEGTVDHWHRRVRQFTPDLAAAFPTRNAIAFLEGLLQQLDTYERDAAENATSTLSLEGLPGHMRTPALTRHFDLLGPAEQDLLRDALLSTLYGQLVVARKYTLALEATGPACASSWVSRKSRTACLALAEANRSMSFCAGAAASLADACAATGVLHERDLG